jgi:hypothetical protein
MTIKQEILTLASKDDSHIDIDKKKRYEIEKGLDFILSHLEEPTVFPRTIMTKKLGYQRKVYSKERALERFIDSDFIDCRINAFPSLKEGATWIPEFLFIDLDRNDFKTDRSLKLALSITLKNIKEKLVEGYPTVLFTGGGYHIYQPVYIQTALENIIEFNGFDRPSEQFLRFAKDNLSNNKADKQNNPSFKSCLLRIPGSINSKYDKQVTIIQKWNGIRPLITREFIEEFRTFLIQKKIDQHNNYRQKILKVRRYINNNYYHGYYYDWIEKKILANPFKDCRKTIVDLILAPYLINIKKLSYEESYQIIRDWLDKCNSLQKLDNYRNFVEYRISYALKNAASKPQIGPMSLYKIKTDDRYSNNLYLLILQKEKE